MYAIDEGNIPIQSSTNLISAFVPGRCIFKDEADYLGLTDVLLKSSKNINNQ